MRLAPTSAERDDSLGDNRRIAQTPEAMVLGDGRSSTSPRPTKLEHRRHDHRRADRQDARSTTTVAMAFAQASWKRS